MPDDGMDVRRTVADERSAAWLTTTLVLLERRDDGVAVVTLDNGKVNALSRRCRAPAARRSPIDLTADPPGRRRVTGGERIFAAGADISEFGGADEAATITAAHPRRARRRRRRSRAS